MVNGRLINSCKKNDTIMLFSTKDSPCDVYLAPKDFCGYVCLINNESEEKSNCKSLRAVIKGALRIIIYSFKDIVKGDELLYFYGSGYKCHWTSKF